ncbi:MAG: DUF1003 domain-containing protein [Simkaniaceae bacterium]|nr:MAG: DUF1003 domain-containing protein [Simkaniaceae bacterium]
MSNNKCKKCEICHEEFLYAKLFPIRLIRNSVLETICKKHPNINKNGFICYPDLREIRSEHIEILLTEDKGALSKLEREVLESLQHQVVLAENVNKKFEKDLSFGEKMADKVAKFGGSWKFILSFFFILIVWMIFNGLYLYNDAFDPYPFILLNLVLSCLAAIQAPIIMMSQNRQAEKDRLQANEEYCTNLKAELEIQQLHSKLDIFMKHQWESLIELQKIQIELAEDLVHHKKHLKSSEDKK